MDGLIGVMSSGQGSVTNNVNGMREVYRGSKAALNQYMRCFAARQAKTPRAMVLMTTGWVRTDLGGPEARLTIEESVPNLVNVLLEKQGSPGVWEPWIISGVPCPGDRRSITGDAACRSRVHTRDPCAPRSRKRNRFPGTVRVFVIVELSG